MDLILITDAQRADVQFLAPADAELVVEFGRMALSVLSRPDKVSAKQFASAGKKLGVSGDDVQRACFALGHTMARANLYLGSLFFKILFEYIANIIYEYVPSAACSTLSQYKSNFFTYVRIK